MNAAVGAADRGNLAAARIAANAEFMLEES